MNDMAGIEELYSVLQDRFFGKYRGFVTSNTDSEARGRLQVRVPNVMGDQLIWALPCVPYAGNGVGFFAMPPVDAGVWIEFEGGDPSYPVWVGCFWSDGQIDSADASPSIKFWKTDSATIRIDDDAGTVTIETSDGSVLTIGSGKISSEASEVSASANGNSHSLSATGFDVNNGALSVM